MIGILVQMYTLSTRQAYNFIMPYSSHEANGLEIDFYLDYSLKLRDERVPEKPMNSHPTAK